MNLEKMCSAKTEHLHGRVLVAVQASRSIIFNITIKILFTAVVGVTE